VKRSLRSELISSKLSCRAQWPTNEVGELAFFTLLRTGRAPAPTRTPRANLGAELEAGGAAGSLFVFIARSSEQNALIGGRRQTAVIRAAIYGPLVPVGGAGGARVAEAMGKWMQRASGAIGGLVGEIPGFSPCLHEKAPNFAPHPSRRGFSPARALSARPASSRQDATD